MPDLATDTGYSNEDATEWSFTIKDGVKWQDGKPITCEDFKYGVSRRSRPTSSPAARTTSSATSTSPRTPDGLPAYNGPYKEEGQADFDKAVTCDGNTITYRFKKPWPDFPLAIASLRAFDPYRADQDKGDKSNLAIFSNGPYMLKGAWDQDKGGTFVRNPEWDGSRRTTTARRTRTRSTSRSARRPRTIIDRLIADSGDDAERDHDRNAMPP